MENMPALLTEKGLDKGTLPIGLSADNHNFWNRQVFAVSERACLKLAAMHTSGQIVQVSGNNNGEHATISIYYVKGCVT